jgi:hypothetical protein
MAYEQGLDMELLAKIGEERFPADGGVNQIIVSKVPARVCVCVCVCVFVCAFMLACV